MVVAGVVAEAGDAVTFCSEPWSEPEPIYSRGAGALHSFPDSSSLARRPLSGELVIEICRQNSELYPIFQSGSYDWHHVGPFETSYRVPINIQIRSAEFT